MKAQTLRTLESPPTELGARAMAEISAWHKPTSVRWLAGAEVAVLAALLWVNAAALPERLNQTAETIRDMSGAVVQATQDVSSHLEDFLTIRSFTEIL